MLPAVTAFLVRHLLPEAGGGTTATGGSNSGGGGSNSGVTRAAAAGLSVFSSPAGLSTAGLTSPSAVLAWSPTAATLASGTRVAAIAAAPDAAPLGAPGSRPGGPLPTPALVLAITTAVALVEHCSSAVNALEPDFVNRLVSALISLGNRPDCPEHVYGAIVRSLEHLVILFELSPVLREAVALLAEATTDGGFTAGHGRLRSLAGTGLLLSCLYANIAALPAPGTASPLGATPGARATVGAPPPQSAEAAFAATQLAISRATPLMSRLQQASHTDGALLAE